MTNFFLQIMFYCLLFFGGKVNAQQPAYTYYTIRDGLPSNDTYNCVEDKKGFLWIATENGLAKFDGKNFKTYTTAQGLPDNEILSVEIDSAGVIWIMPFQRNPAYYDEKSDRFINSNTNDELKKIKLASVNKANVLSGGGMAFCNSNGGIFIFENNLCSFFSLPQKSTITYPGHFIVQLQKNTYVSVSSDSLRVWKNGKFIRSQYLGRKIYRTAFVNGNIYLGDLMRLVKIPLLPDGTLGKAMENILPFEISTLNFTGNQIAVSSSNGNIYLADTATLAFSQRGFSFNALIRFLYEDKAGNTWICTKENGLIRYQQKGILTIGGEAFQRNFNTLTFFKNELVAGTNDGRLLYYTSPYNHTEKILLSQKSYSNWVRRIIPVNSQLFIASEGPLYISNKKKITELPLRYSANKDIFLVNDTMMIIGNTGYVKKINLITKDVIDSQLVRVTKLNASSTLNIYVGSNSGLYCWQGKNPLYFLGDDYVVLTNRVSSFAYNKVDDILWVGLAVDTLVALRNNIVVGTIALGVNLPGNICRALYSKKKGVVWVGTNKALARINYSFKNNNLLFKTSVFTTADGIAGKQINDIAEWNDTMYIATTGGISIVPAGLNYTAREIPVFISGIKINNKDAVLKHEYELPWNSNNISIIYTATDLAATTERIYQYSINKAPWITTQNENIELQQLASGKYTLQVRALKRNGSPSAIFAEVVLKINTPFWRSAFFYVLLFVSTLLLFFYFMQRQSRKKQELNIQKILTEKRMQELELKALKAQINPHFVFNCLNSIKFLNHKKRFAETEKYLDKFSYLLRKTLDFSGLQQITLHEELEYSHNYLELEKLRLGEKMHFEINVQLNINPYEIMVPPMLFQPYLENAVKHGLRYLKNNMGAVVIDIQKQTENIICVITDNGIGIENSNELNKRIHPKHTSLGNTLQERRAALYGITVAIEQRKESSGTQVILTLNNASAS